MRRSLNDFLRARVRVDRGPALGRSFAVLQESWSLRDDPKLVRPKRRLLATRQTAAEAADAARVRAADYAEHGFHKPSGAWWGSDGVRFHRFLVTSRRPPRPGILAAAIAAGVGIGVWRYRARSRMSP